MRLAPDKAAGRQFLITTRKDSFVGSVEIA
jgi:hypothetical protein